MKRRLTALALCLLLCLAQVAGAEEIVAGEMALATEQGALEAGLALRTETSFAWGDLPLLEADTDKALGSLLKALKVRTSRQQLDGNGYYTADLLLQNVSVLDLSMYAIDGVYYETSNLLGGQVVAFTPEEFATFMGHMSARSAGALPLSLSTALTALMQALGGMQSAPVDMDTIDDATAAFEAWRADALTQSERLRPKVVIPGLYGLRAVVVDVTGEELLALAQVYSTLLADNEALWMNAAEAQLPGADDETLHETAVEIGKVMRQLPELLGAYLPADWPPAEYREIYGLDGSLVSYQLEATLPEDLHLYLEWTPEGADAPAAFFSVGAGGSEMELLVTREVGKPQTIGKTQQVTDRTVAQWHYEEPSLRLDIMMTGNRSATLSGGKETVNTSVSWMMESDALLGEGAVVTLTADTQETASGTAGKDYARKAETVWRLKGLGFDSLDILTVSSKTTAEKAAAPAAPDAALYPGRMAADELDVWLEGIQVYPVQVLFTVMGRLPSDVAAYVLQRQQ